LTLEALRRYFLYANLKVELAEALAPGSLLAQPGRFQGKRVCCIVSGGNVNPLVYAVAYLFLRVEKKEEKRQKKELRPSKW